MRTFFLSIFSIGFILILGFTCFSCKSSQSDTLVSGGLSTDEYPAVIELKYKTKKGWFSCSSFVVSSNTLLTAAHCLIDATDLYIKLDQLKIKPSDLSFNPNFKSDDLKKTSQYDIGVVVFKEDVFLGISPLELYDGPVAQGLKVRLVGYGCITELKDGLFRCSDSDPLSTKRTGINYIVENKRCHPGLLEVITKNAQADLSFKQDPTGTDVYLGSGDSGGPLLLEKDHSKVVGIASRTMHVVNKDSTTEKIESIEEHSCFSIPTSPKNLDYLFEAIEKLNAKISNLNERSKKN